MSPSKTVLDTGYSGKVWAVMFQPDGMHVLSGNSGGIQRWRISDGQEVGKQFGMDLNAISVSRDQKWIVCGTDSGACVWDAGIQEKVTEVEGVNQVRAVDISPDSTRLATGIVDEVNIWSIRGGERLVGPLKHDSAVTGVRFSPNGQQIATSRRGARSVCIFDSQNGHQLIDINTIAHRGFPITPLAWSNDGQQIFTALDDNQIKSFALSTGSQLAESLTLNDVHSISLAGNGKFIATVGLNTISFLDVSTLAKIGTAIEDSEKMWSVAISSDSSRIATGREDGKIVIHNLANFLPDSYGPFQTSTREEQLQDEELLTFGSHDNKPADSEPIKEEPGKSNRPESETHSDVGDGDLEGNAPSSSPGPQFDYNESLSLSSSSHPRDDETPPAGPSHAISQSLGATPVTTSRREACPEENSDHAESSQGHSILKRWLRWKINKHPGSPKPDRPPAISRDPRPRSQPPARENATNKAPSTIAAGQRVRRAVAKPVVQQQDKDKSPRKPAARNRAHKKNPRAGQGTADPKATGATQQANDPSQQSAGRVNVTRESGDAIVAVRFPGWMCFCSGTGDGTH